MRKAGFTGISARQWNAHLRDGSPLPARPVVLTFDDAYADLCTWALPEIEKNGFEATVFVVTGRFGARNDWDTQVPMTDFPLMDVSQIREWAARNIDFGAHTRTHPDLRTLQRQAATDEIVGSGDDLEHLLGTPVVSFAYPYGKYDDQAAALARERFPLSFVIEERLADAATDRSTLARFTIVQADTPTVLVWTCRLGWNPRDRLDRWLRRQRRHSLAARMVRRGARNVARGRLRS